MIIASCLFWSWHLWALLFTLNLHSRVTSLHFQSKWCFGVFVGGFCRGYIGYMPFCSPSNFIQQNPKADWKARHCVASERGLAWRSGGLSLLGNQQKLLHSASLFSRNLVWKWDKPPYKRFRYNKEQAVILENSAEADNLQDPKPSLGFTAFVRNRPFQINFAVVWPNWILRMDLTSFSSSHRTGLRSL